MIMHNRETETFLVPSVDSGSSSKPVEATGAALLENNEASAKLTTANGGTFTLSSARLSSQSRNKTFDQ